jgi:hypothetical protein
MGRVARFDNALTSKNRSVNCAGRDSAPCCAPSIHRITDDAISQIRPVESPMRFRVIPLALASALLSACATDISPVAFEMPISRMEMPERTAGIVHMAGGGGGENYLVLSRDQLTSAPNPARPEFDSCPKAVDGGAVFYDSSNDHCSNGLFFRTDARIGDHVQIGLKRSWDELLTGQVKAYILGPKPGRAKPGDHSLAATIAYGGDSVESDGDGSQGSFSSEVDRRVVDLGLVYGHRWQRWLMSYGGVFYNHHSYSGTHRATTGSSSTTREFEGTARMAGANIGLKFDFGTPIVGGILECARAHMTAGSTSRYVSRCAASVEVTFAGLQKNRPTPARSASKRRPESAPRK